ncbi:class I SAM-dependent methyltransferase [Flindersiella endophytica]
MTSAHSISAPYEQLVAEALAAPFAGWDFSWLRDRTSGEQLTWDYSHLAKAALTDATAVLDIDTGGGELLAGLAPLPRHAVASEAWDPNLPVARERLEPLGVSVRAGRGEDLPAVDGEFDLVLNRHGAFTPGELWRVLVPGGVFLTQQPGSRNDQEFSTALGTHPPVDPESHTLASVTQALRGQGFAIEDAREEMPAYRYHDIAAVIFQLRAVSWTVPDFDVDRYDTELRQLDARIRAEGPFVTHNHRFLVRARKPA